ncbi:uncharacterized protein DS421_2g54470 [Arachis hypogaea]|nr:uncharacterized protein DS421_2g54470 [Arachis hypogaea]
MKKQNREKLWSLVELVARPLRLRSILLKEGVREGKQGGSSWEQKGTKRWVARVDSALWRNLEESVLKRKALRLMSPSLPPRTKTSSTIIYCNPNHVC